MKKLLNWLSDDDYMTIHINRVCLIFVVLLGTMYGMFKWGYNRAIKDVVVMMQSLQQGQVEPQGEHLPTDGEPGKMPPRA